MFRDPSQDENREVVQRYIAAALQIPDVQLTASPARIPTGVENRNYHLGILADGQHRDLILRCPPANIPAWRTTHGLYDLLREFMVLHELEAFHIGAPRVCGYSDGKDLGAECFLMEALPGRPLVDFLIPQTDSRYLEQFADCLVTISRIDYRQSQWLKDSLPRWTSEWWFEYIVSAVPSALQDELFKQTLEWLKARQPARTELVFAHGDANPGNFLVSQDKISGIVDWEFAGLSDDPLAEISFFVWLYDGQLAQPLAQAICTRLGRDLREVKWYFVRSWLGMTYQAVDSRSPLFTMRRDCLRELIGVRSI